MPQQWEEDVGLRLGVAGPVVAKGLLGGPYRVLLTCEVSFSNSTTAGDGPTSRTVREQESILNASLPPRANRSWR